jgi:NADPH2:quinone reductase
MYGPPEVVVVEDVTEPVPGPGDVLVETRAAAVNFPDVLIVADKYQISVPVPFTPGSEIAGIVRAIGAGINAFAPGDAVFGAVMIGAFAEQVVVSAAALTRIPNGFDFGPAAAFGVAHTTAYHALRSIAEVQAGEWVVVTGAAGGVGLAAVEIAQILGGRVIALASTKEKRDLCLQRGAEHVIAYRDEDVKTRLREITGPGADVVLDQVGGPVAEQALRATRWGGRFVTVGYASGEIPRIPLNLILLKGVVVLGFEARSFAHHAPDLATRDRRELFDLVETGRIDPYIGARFPLANVADALQLVAAGEAMGKVVIDIPT